MTVKRTCICHSSSSDETCALPTRKDLQFWKSTSMLENKQRKPGIFSVSSPVRETVDRRGEDVSRQMCGFLEQCFYCSKKLTPDIDIFMYSLRAFCTEECRQKRIDIDMDLELLCLNPRTKRVNTCTKQSYLQGRPGYFWRCKRTLESSQLESQACRVY